MRSERNSRFLATQFHFILAGDPLLRCAPYRTTLMVKILQKIITVL